LFFIVGEVFQFDAMLGFPRQGFRGLDGGAKLIERGSGDPKFGERGQVVRAFASVVLATERMVSSEKAGRFMLVLLHLIESVNRVRRLTHFPSGCCGFDYKTCLIK